MFDRHDLDLIQKVKDGKVIIDVYQLAAPDLSGDGVMRPGATFDETADRWNVPALGDGRATSTYGEGRTWVGMLDATQIDKDGRFSMMIVALPTGFAAGQEPPTYALTFTNEARDVRNSRPCVGPAIPRVAATTTAMRCATSGSVTAST